MTNATNIRRPAPEHTPSSGEVRQTLDTARCARMARPGDWSLARAVAVLHAHRWHDRRPTRPREDDLARSYANDAVRLVESPALPRESPGPPTHAGASSCRSKRCNAPEMAIV